MVTWNGSMPWWWKKLMFPYRKNLPKQLNEVNVVNGDKIDLPVKKWFGEVEIKQQSNAVKPPTDVGEEKGKRITDTWLKCLCNFLRSAIWTWIWVPSKYIKFKYQD